MYPPTSILSVTEIQSVPGSAGGWVELRAEVMFCGGLSAICLVENVIAGISNPELLCPFSPPPPPFNFFQRESKGKLSICSKVCYAIGGAPYQITGCALGFFLQIYLLDVAQVSPAAQMRFSGGGNRGPLKQAHRSGYCSRLKGCWLEQVGIECSFSKMQLSTLPPLLNRDVILTNI